MPFHGSSAVWAAACVGLVAALGCNDYSPRFSPPQPGDPIEPGDGAAGGGGNGAGGATSASGGTGGSGGSGGTTATPPNPCECAYSSITDAACGSCVNNSSSHGCSDAALTCDADPECKALKDCPQECNAAADKALCMQQCLLPITNQKFTVYAECVCLACAATCATDPPIACE